MKEILSAKAGEKRKPRGYAARRGFLTLFVLVMLLGLLPGSDAHAASAKKKAMKAYASFLAKHPPRTFRNYGDAAFSAEDKSYVNSYFLYDMDKNGVPELFTYTNVNARWYIVRVYTYRNKKVTLCKFADGCDAEFDNNASANGGYSFFICKQGHIHNSYSGGMEANEFIYKGAKDGTLKNCLRYQEIRFSYPYAVTAWKGSKEIAEQKYRSYTKKCTVRRMTSYKNNKKNRNALKKGKA